MFAALGDRSQQAGSPRGPCQALATLLALMGWCPYCVSRSGADLPSLHLCWCGVPRVRDALWRRPTQWVSVVHLARQDHTPPVLKHGPMESVAGASVKPIWYRSRVLRPVVRICAPVVWMSKLGAGRDLDAW